MLTGWESGGVCFILWWILQGNEKKWCYVPSELGLWSLAKQYIALEVLWGAGRLLPFQRGVSEDLSLKKTCPSQEFPWVSKVTQIFVGVHITLVSLKYPNLLTLIVVYGMDSRPQRLSKWKCWVEEYLLSCVAEPFLLDRCLIMLCASSLEKTAFYWNNCLQDLSWVEINTCRVSRGTRAVCHGHHERTSRAAECCSSTVFHQARVLVIQKKCIVKDELSGKLWKVRCSTIKKTISGEKVVLDSVTTVLQSEANKTCVLEESALMRREAAFGWVMLKSTRSDKALGCARMKN